MQLITSQTLKDLLEDSQHTVLLIDVREDSEWFSGAIPGAVHIPLGQLNHSKVFKEPFKHIIFQCRSGVRSQTACNIVEDYTPEDVTLYSLTGGIHGWVSMGYPTYIPNSHDC